MMISEQYRKLNRQLHESNEAYGTSGHKWAKQIATLANEHGLETLLDFGSGKGTLKCALGGDERIAEYDPAIPGKDKLPEKPVDMVVCTDVMEHVEPEFLYPVLGTLRKSATKLVFLTIATRPAKKVLADGRNAHLIQKSADWWLGELLQYFLPVQFEDRGGGEFVFVGRPRP